jgi:3-hydroxyisobutyrate dehydrogenase-like beta-hydroxyacid dehydrogenase
MQQLSPTASPATTVVGFVGLGRMGRPMTRHIRAAGYRVRGYDPDPDAREAVRAHGVTVCDSAGDAAVGCAVVVIMPGTTEQVRDALTGPSGVLATAEPGTTVIVSSTISPSDARGLGEQCAAAGIRFLDAPVCRGEAGAEERDLLWFAGGDREALDAVRPVLETCGTEVFHLGVVGTGMVGKAMNNLLLSAAAIADRDMKIISSMADETGLSLPLAGILREMVKPLMIETGCQDLICP